MALNLIRNARAFFTTNVNATTGVIAEATNATTGNTFELQVLDGFSFSQNTNNETVSINEAGTTPQRGQRSFNTSLAPVDFSFSTYIRPYYSTNVKCEESVLWNALLGSDAVNTQVTFAGTISTGTYTASTGTLAISGTGMTVLTAGTRVLITGITSTVAGDVRIVNGPATVTGTPSATSVSFLMHNQVNTTSDTPAGTTGTLTVSGIKLYSSAWGEAPNSSIAAGHRSNTNQLQKFGMVVIVDSVTYLIDNCALNQATIDFGLDGIATVQWTGQATALRQLATNATAANGSFGGGLGGSYTPKNTGAGFITNKLSTCKLKAAKALTGVTNGTGYYLALTGGSITINNNISYITPAILGVVNQAATYYTGARSVTGTLNAYLNTGSLTGQGVTLDGVTYTKGTGELLKDLLGAASTETEPMFYIELAVGGVGNALRVELQMPSVSVGIPSINTEQVVSTAINFTAAPSSGAYASRTYDLTETNELTVRYYAPAA